MSSSSSLPPDYLERVYAGVLGKIIGVYLGRPFEGWTHQRIVKELGPVYDYVHDKVGVPLVVPDDDVSGTFGFVRALEEHGTKSDLTAEEIGKTWLNNVVERRSVFWWGGNGISTEHTAFLNLKHGIPAPQSGSIETNGKTVAEQIGAQIFIDGWALVAPGKPDLAARLAGAAGSVSHDGESVFAAQLWAAMEAEAFVSKDVDHLLDTGLKYVPQDCLIARVIAQVRSWAKEDGDWTKTRQRIEDNHGYDKFCGVCHVVPNHAIMIMALIYGGQDFHRAMHIINTCGWDTDCNSGNVGCLVAIMHGMASFDGGPDWRGPVADRAIISSADGGYSINNSARIALDVANMGRRLAGEKPLAAPKDGAQFHFTLPGSVQGFQATTASTASVRLEQAVDGTHGPGLAVHLGSLWKESGPVEVLTHTFTPKEAAEMGSTYLVMASPLVYPGQRVKATLRGTAQTSGAVNVCLRLKVYNSDGDLVSADSSAIVLDPGSNNTQALEWTIPDDMDSQPIQEIGIAITAADRPVDGTIWLDSLRWDGAPTLSLRRPTKGSSDLWKSAWVQGADVWNTFIGSSVCIAHDRGEGVTSYGTREWTDYSVTVSQFSVKIGGPAGVAVRVQGLNRYYALMFSNGQSGSGRSVALIKALDEKRIELASTEFEWELDAEYEVSLEAEGSTIRARVGGKELTASEDQYAGGAMGFVVTDGSLSAGTIKIGAVRSGV